MVKLKGTKTEIQEIVIDVEDDALIEAIQKRLNLEGLVLSADKKEIGYWNDESSERSNYSNWQWHLVSKNEKRIELLKAINLIKKHLVLYE